MAFHKRHNIGGTFVSGDETGIAHLKKLDSSELEILFRNVQELGESPFETYRGEKYIITRNADYTMVVACAGTDEPGWA